MDHSIEIDGAEGEGGGQIIRTSLTLSILMQKPFHIRNIRAKRTKPGLQAQHIQAVQAATLISQAEVRGNKLGSSELFFSPKAVRHGRYEFKIGTAGSTLLVYQTIMLPLSTSKGKSEVTIYGGTHVPWSPVFHYVKMQWLHFLNHIGFSADLEIVKAGFYPLGGGEIITRIPPLEKVHGLTMKNRGELISIRGLSMIGNLNMSIATRQKHQALSRLESICRDTKIKNLELSALGKGTCMLIIAQFDQGQCCYTSLGAPGKRAEIVADEAVDSLFSFLETEANIDEYLADQLLLPLILSDETSSFSTSKVTSHLLTNASIIHQFTDAKIFINGDPEKAGIIHVVPISRIETE